MGAFHVQYGLYFSCKFSVSNAGIFCPTYSICYGLYQPRFFLAQSFRDYLETFAYDGIRGLCFIDLTCFFGYFSAGNIAVYISDSKWRDGAGYFLHLKAAFKESRIDNQKEEKDSQGWLAVCPPSEIRESRAKIFKVGDERVAIFKHEGNLSAIHNVCKHQGGPLGEGKIVDGCITCPWHGYQYLPHNGQSPPPFTEKVKTYQLKIENNWVYIYPKANPEGTEVQPLPCKS